jgi:hypothetical protein
VAKTPQAWLEDQEFEAGRAAGGKAQAKKNPTPISMLGL